MSAIQYDKSEKTVTVFSPKALEALAYLKEMHDKWELNTKIKILETWLDKQPDSDNE